MSGSVLCFADGEPEIHRTSTLPGYRRGMPATIPSHQAPVLALKLARPGRFDGVALVVGSAAPDAAYAVAGLGVDIPSHAWHALFWFCVPMTWLVAMLIRRAAPYVAAHLP